MFRYTILIVTVLLTAALYLSCSDRGTNIEKPGYTVRSGYESSIALPGGHQVSTELAFSMFDPVRKSPTVNFRVYNPLRDGVPLIGGSDEFPVLYLLAPFRGNELYYFNHGLAAIADRMIAEGEIDPMLIVCVDGTPGYGGTWYGDTWAGGKWARVVGDIEGEGPEEGYLIDYIDGVYNTIKERGSRAVSGFGMGGYGAFRVATAYSENFGSVSAVSAPLDFDGADSTGGFKLLFKEIIQNLDDQGLGYISHAEYKLMDTAYENPIRTMMIAAACAFTPHYDYGGWMYFGYPPAAESTYIFDDTMTLIHPEGEIWFHLPFDEWGNITDTNIIDTTIIVDTLGVADTLIDTVGFYDSIWGIWMSNNIESILAAHPGALDSTAVQLYTIADDQYGFNLQTLSFANFLSTQLGRQIQPLQFDGYEGYSATANRFTYDILPAILKFHSDEFRKNAE